MVIFILCMVAFYPARIFASRASPLRMPSSLASQPRSAEPTKRAQHSLQSSQRGVEHGQFSQFQFATVHGAHLGQRSRGLECPFAAMWVPTTVCEVCKHKSQTFQSGSREFPAPPAQSAAAERAAVRTPDMAERGGDAL